MYQNYTQPARFTHKTNRRVGIERKRKRQTKRREKEREQEKGGGEVKGRENRIICMVIKQEKIFV